MTGLTDLEGNEIGKLFVGGLAQATNQESLQAYFSKFGDVDEAVVMMDHRTGRSRGFGYVKFSQNSSVDVVMESKPHILDGKEIDAKQCNVHMRGKNRRSLKVFVGGISTEHDAGTLKEAFEKYGTVTDVNLMMDHTKQRHRGFAFVGFQEENVVKQLIQLHYVNICGKEVEIKAMEPPNYEKKVESTSARPVTPNSSKYGTINPLEYPGAIPGYAPGGSNVWRQVQGIAPGMPNQVMPPWNVAYSSWPQVSPGVAWPQWSMTPVSSSMPLHNTCEYTQPWLPHWGAAYNGVPNGQQQWYATAPTPTTPNALPHVWQACPSNSPWAMSSMNGSQMPQNLASGMAMNSTNSTFMPTSSETCIQANMAPQGAPNATSDANTAAGAFLNLSESKPLTNGNYWDPNASATQNSPGVGMMPCWAQGSNPHLQPNPGATDPSAQHAMGQLNRRGVVTTSVRTGSLEYDEQGFGTGSNPVDGAVSNTPTGMGSNSGDIYNWIYSGMKDIKYVSLLPSENHPSSELQSPDGAAGDYSRPESSMTPFHPTQLFSMPR